MVVGCVLNQDTDGGGGGGFGCSACGAMHDMVLVRTCCGRVVCDDCKIVEQCACKVYAPVSVRCGALTNAVFIARGVLSVMTSSVQRAQQTWQPQVEDALPRIVALPAPADALSAPVEVEALVRDDMSTSDESGADYSPREVCNFVAMNAFCALHTTQLLRCVLGAVGGIVCGRGVGG